MMEILKKELIIDQNTPEGKEAFYKFLPMIFAFGGFFGFIYEEIFYLIDLGYLTKRGSTFGPWIPIYGFGAAIIFITTIKWRRKCWPVGLIGMAGCFVLEYATGYVLFEYFNGLRLWDYNTEIWNWGNINGYVCFRSILFFGASAIFLMNILVPLFDLLYSKRKKAFFITGCILALIAVIDTALKLTIGR